MLPVSYRTPTPADHPFIYSTWLKSYRHSDWARNMSNDTFFFHHKQIIEAILECPTTKITLICDQEDPDQLYGYCVARELSDKAVIHFCYVKYNFRKLGLMKQLVENAGYFSKSITFITHIPRNYADLKAKWNLEYNPYLLGDIS